jgi:flagellar hook-length control protein FliK
MNAAALDPISTLAPLEAFTSPPPAPPSSNDPGQPSFADHLAPPPERAEDRVPPKSEPKPPAAAAPPHSHAKPETSPHRAEEKETKASDKPASGDTSGDQQPSAEAVAQAGEVAVEKEKVKEEPQDESDEVVLSTVALQHAQPVAAPHAHPKVQPKEDDKHEAALAEKQPENKGRSGVGGVPGKAKQATPKPAVVSAKADVEAKTHSSPAQKIDADKQATAAEIIDANPAVEQAVAAISPASPAKPGDKKLTKPNKETSAKLTDEAVKQTAAESPHAEIDADETPAKPAGVKPRDSKRERARAELKAAATKSDDPATPGMAPPLSNEAAAAAPTITPPSAPPPVDTTPNLSIAPPPPLTAATPPPVVDANSSAQRLPQHLTGRNVERPRGSAPVTPVEQTRFVQRVAKAFQTAQSRGGELQLRLSPPALGSLKLEIKVQDGVMNARIEAENQNAKNMLVENLPVLKDRLAEQGIVVEKFDVDLMDRQPQGQPEMQQQRERRPASSAPRFAAARDTETTDTTAAPSLRSDGRLNVTV